MSNEAKQTLQRRTTEKGKGKEQKAKRKRERAKRKPLEKGKRENLEKK